MINDVFHSVGKKLFFKILIIKAKSNSHSGEDAAVGWKCLDGKRFLGSTKNIMRMKHVNYVKFPDKYVSIKSSNTAIFVLYKTTVWAH